MENMAQFSREKNASAQNRFDSLPALESIQSWIYFTVQLLNYTRVRLEWDQYHPAETLLEHFFFLIAVFSPA